MNRIAQRLIITALFVLSLGLIIIYGRGYRINIGKKTIDSTGILVASSHPDGARILINDELRGATNSNVVLRPGKYRVKIVKDGFSPWSKSIVIKGELVLKINAALYPLNPSLSPITSLGIVQAFSSPTSSKIILTSQSGDEEKDGIYQLDTRNRPLSITNPLKLIALQTSFTQEDLDFESIHVIFSPDEKQVIISFGDKTKDTQTYLLSTEELNSEPFDISQSVDSITDAWEHQKELNVAKILETFDDPLPKIATDSFNIIQSAPDGSKILYEATNDDTIPLIIEPPIIASNQTPEKRNIKKGKIYVYDKKEDKNFQIDTKDSKLTINNYLWSFDSTHIVIKEKDNISIVDYDGENKRAVYSGPFENGFISVSGDGKLLILANLNPQSNKLPDVYAVGIQ